MTKEELEKATGQELIDARDNLRLPIMYYSISKHNKCWFYILHGRKMYLYIVKAVDLEEEENEKNLNVYFTVICNSELRTIAERVLSRT